MGRAIRLLRWLVPLLASLVRLGTTLWSLYGRQRLLTPFALGALHADATTDEQQENEQHEGANDDPPKPVIPAKCTLKDRLSAR